MSIPNPSHVLMPFLHLTIEWLGCHLESISLYHDALFFNTLVVTEIIGVYVHGYTKLGDYIRIFLHLTLVIEYCLFLMAVNYWITNYDIFVSLKGGKKAQVPQLVMHLTPAGCTCCPFYPNF